MGEPWIEKQGRWHRHEHGWAHRPWWKVAINTGLRALQPWTRRKWVVFTNVDATAESTRVPPVVTGYGFGRIEHRQPAAVRPARTIDRWGVLLPNHPLYRGPNE